MGTAEPDKNFLQQTIDWFSGTITSAGELAKRIGLPLTVLIVLAAAGGFLWWKWKEIKERPGIEGVIKRFKRRAIGAAPAGVLTIAVAQARNFHRQLE